MQPRPSRIHIKFPHCKLMRKSRTQFESRPCCIINISLCWCCIIYRFILRNNAFSRRRPLILRTRILRPSAPICRSTRHLISGTIIIEWICTRIISIISLLRTVIVIICSRRRRHTWQQRKYRAPQQKS